MSGERLAGRLSDMDLERELKAALLMDASGQVPDELRAAVAVIRDEWPLVSARGRRRFRIPRAAVAAAAAVAVIAASLGAGWALRGGIAGPAATATPTGLPSSPSTNPSPSPTPTPTPPSTATPRPTPRPTSRAWTGLDWSALAGFPDVNDVAGVASWNGTLIAIGHSKQGNGETPMAYWSSADGRAWKTLGVSGAAGSGWQLPHGLVATSLGLVAYGRYDMAGPGALWISRDGLTWQAPSSFSPVNGVVGVADGPTGLVAVTNQVVMNGVPRAAEMWTSESGASWQRLSLDPAQFPAGSSFGTVRATPSGYFVGGCICNGTNAAAAWWSLDGRTWQRAQVGESDKALGFGAIHAGSGGFVATGFASGNRFLAWWSSDGRDWQPISMPGVPSSGNGTYGVYDDGSRLIAISGAQRTTRLWMSTDGKIWQELKVTRTIAADDLPDWTQRPSLEVVVRPDGIVLVATVDNSSSAWVLTAR